MLHSLQLLPGVTLRCFRDDRFKQGCLSLQFLRPMCPEEASLNALLPAVLLRGCREYPDLRSITQRLDDLYGASVSALARRVGDYQTTGFYCAFMDDRFVLAGDRILEPVIDLVRMLLLEPVVHDESFSPEFVESEKQNLTAAIESDLNDKRAYAASRLLRTMCKADSYGIPRLGTVEQVAAITPESLCRHYRKVLQESPVELFYVGSRTPEQIAPVLKNLLEGIDRCYVNLPAQTAFHDAGGSNVTEQMDVTQAKLCMGFVTPITNRTADFAAMQVFNTLFGSGMTSKLFMNIREKLSLCYAISSDYFGSKGILTVSAGIDSAKAALTRSQILQQLEDCCQGRFTAEELAAAKAALRSSLLGVHDAPGSIEGYYGTAALSGMNMTPEAYLAAVEAVTAEAVTKAAASLRLHTVYLLKEESPC